MEIRKVALLPSHIEPDHVRFGRQLEGSGFEISWITHTAYDAHWLRQAGMATQRVLEARLTDADRYSEREIDEALARLDAEGAPFVNDIVAMDRRLRHTRNEYARRYVAHAEIALTRFLAENRVEFIANGRDTALHLTAHKVAARLGITSVVATLIRMPDGRFGFCPGYTEAEFIPLREVTEEDRGEARRFYEEFRKRGCVPETSRFARRNARFLRRIPRDLVMFSRMAYRAAFDPGNRVGRYSLPNLLQMFLRRRMNAAHISLFPPFDPLPQRPYIFFPLHMQPESSIDVLGSHVSNQHNLIELIAKATPSSHDVVVKPHPDHIGGLSLAQLRALRKIPGVKLISPHLDSHSVIQNASVVLTVTGTAAIESSFYGVPAIIFAKEFFRTLPNVHYCRSASELPRLLPDVISHPSAEDTEMIVEFIAQHLACSYVGRFTNYLGRYTEEELSTLVEAYSCVYDRTRTGSVSGRVATVVNG